MYSFVGFCFLTTHSIYLVPDGGQQLDVTAKTGRVVNLTQVLFRKPRATSSFARISQTMNRVKTPSEYTTFSMHCNSGRMPWSGMPAFSESLTTTSNLDTP